MCGQERGYSLLPSVKWMGSERERGRSDCLYLAVGGLGCIWHGYGHRHGIGIGDEDGTEADSRSNPLLRSPAVPSVEGLGWAGRRRRTGTVSGPGGGEAETDSAQAQGPLAAHGTRGRRGEALRPSQAPRRGVGEERGGRSVGRGRGGCVQYV